MSALSAVLHSRGPQDDLEALLTRMRQRLYPETIPVLASCWLRTVYASSHPYSWWKELDELLQQTLQEPLQEPMLNDPSREGLLGIQAWIEESVLRAGKAPDIMPQPVEPFRTILEQQQAAAYTVRLLNEWLPVEVAHLLINQGDDANGYDTPTRAVGRALGQLLMRAHLSPETLEMLLQPEPLSAREVYPAHLEMFQDVVLALLGRCSAPASRVLPALLFGVASGTLLPADYGEAVRRTAFAQDGNIRVPIPAGRVREILSGGPVRLASIIVTMDGRWWKSESLQTGQQHSVVYKPGGRLRIDYTAEHATLAAPWPDTQLQWRGAVDFQDPLEIFGRDWRASSWETDGEQTWLRLAFSRVLPVEELAPSGEHPFRQSHSAAVDMAWSALENAVALAISQKSRQPIEQLRRPDFIPLGRAILELAENAKSPARREAIRSQLRAVHYFQAQLASAYGRIPWRILPAAVRRTVLGKQPDPDLPELLNQTFDGLPGAAP